MAVTLTPVKSTTSKTARETSAASAADKIVSADEVEAHFKICLYGRNKIGKTKFACSSNLKTLVIDCNERGFASVRKRPNVDIYQISRWEELDAIYWYLKAGNHPYEVVVIDTITMLASVGMKWVLKDDVDRDMNKDPLMPSRPTYLKLGEIMKDTIIRFRNLPYHIIFNAQEKTSTEDDEEGNTLIETHPELSPAPRSVLLSATNINARIFVREVEKEVKGVTKKVMQRRMLMGSVPRYVAGRRFEELRDVEVIADDDLALQRFIDRVYGEKPNADTQ